MASERATPPVPANALTRAAARREAAPTAQRGTFMSWTDYFLQHAESAERKARELSGYAREKQHVVAATFRAMARDCQFVDRLR